MAKAFVALAFLGLLLLAIPMAGAQQLTVPVCPAFASTLPAASVTATPTTGSGLSSGTYYIAYTVGIQSATATGTVAKAVLEPNGQSSGSNFILTAVAPVSSGSQVNFYMGTSQSSLYLVTSGQSGNSITVSSLPSASNGSLPEQSVTSCIALAMPLASIGILLSMMLVGVSYMIGEIFQISGFKNWYKGELWETAKSIMIIAVVFTALLFSSDIAYALTGGTPATTGSQSLQTSANLASLYSTADGYVSAQLSNAANAFTTLFSLADGLGLLNSLTFTSWIPIIPIPFVGALQTGSSVNIFQSNFIESNTHSPASSLIKDVLTIIILPVIIILQVLSDMLTGIMLLGLTVLLPIGIVLRAIPFLRGLGGTLIAMGIAVSLIFPALLVGFNIPVSSYLQTQSLNEFSFSCNTGNGFLNLLICTPMTTAENVANQAFIGTRAFGWGLSTLFSPTPNIYGVMNVISVYTFPTILQLLLFIIDLIITFALGDAIARSLGGNLRLGIGKFKVA